MTTAVPDELHQRVAAAIAGTREYHAGVAFGVPPEARHAFLDAIAAAAADVLAEQVKCLTDDVHVAHQVKNEWRNIADTLAGETARLEELAAAVAALKPGADAPAAYKRGFDAARTAAAASIRANTRADRR